MLLSADLPRLSRDPCEVETLSRLLRAAGVSIITVAEGAFYGIADMVRRVGGQLSEDRAERSLIHGYEMTVNHVNAILRVFREAAAGVKPVHHRDTAQ